MSETGLWGHTAASGGPGGSQEFQERLRSYPVQWTGQVDKEVLAGAGFTYTGTGDKVECKQCHLKLLNWSPSDNALLEHATRRPNCSFVRDNYGGRIPPKNPKYTTLQSRLDSFTDWPTRFVPKTPQELAEAGFFYIGSADRVTCFQCGITLRDWESEHDPVTEHLRYSDNCPFINKPDLTLLGVQPRTQSSDNSASAFSVGLASQPDQRTATQTLASVAQSSGDTGVSPPEGSAILSQTEVTAPELAISAEAGATASLGILEVPPSGSVPSLAAELEATSLEGQQSTGEGLDESGHRQRVLAENRRLKEKRMCRVCGVKTASILFLPCGHILVCADCQSRVSTCPLCGTSIRGTVKTYLA